MTADTDAQPEPDQTPAMSPAENQLRALGAYHSRVIAALAGVVDDLPKDHPQRSNIEHLIETADNQ